MTEIVESNVSMIEIAAHHGRDSLPSMYIQPLNGEVKFFTDGFGSWFKFNRENTHTVMPISRLLSVEYVGHSDLIGRLL